MVGLSNGGPRGVGVRPPPTPPSEALSPQCLDTKTSDPQSVHGLSDLSEEHGVLMSRLTGILERFELRLKQTLDTLVTGENLLLDDPDVLRSGATCRFINSQQRLPPELARDVTARAHQSVWSMGQKGILDNLAVQDLSGLTQEQQQGTSVPTDVTSCLTRPAPLGLNPSEELQADTQPPILWSSSGSTCQATLKHVDEARTPSGSEVKMVAEAGAGSLSRVESADQEGREDTHPGASLNRFIRLVSHKESARDQGTKSINSTPTKTMTFSECEYRRKMAAKRRAMDDDTERSSGDENSGGFRHRLEGLVTNHVFEAVIATLIVANSVLIGLEVEIQANSQEESVPIVFFFLNAIFTGIFTLELVLRVRALKGKFFASGSLYMSCLDVVLVMIGLIDTCVQSLRLFGALHSTSVDDLSTVRLFRVLRITRMLRMLRMTRLVAFVASLRTLLASIWATLQSLMWAGLLLLSIIYIVAVVFTQAAADHFREVGRDPAIEEFWGTVPVAMLTLFESVAGGLSWHVVLGPLHTMSSALVGIFTLYIFFTYFAVLNVFTAVFCQGAIETVGQDPDLAALSVMQRKRLYVDKLQRFFQSVDRDHSGEITIDELEKLLSDKHMQAYMAAMGVDVADAWTMFKLMDEDENLTIDVGEFVQGMMRLQGAAKSVDIQAMLDTQKWITRRLANLSGEPTRPYCKTAHRERGDPADDGPFCLPPSRDACANRSDDVKNEDISNDARGLHANVSSRMMS